MRRGPVVERSKAATYTCRFALNRLHFAPCIQFQSQDDKPYCYGISIFEGTGNLQYQEFARKFASYKATHSLHRHADFRDKEQAKVLSLHGVDAASRVQKHAAIRNTETITWGVSEEQYDENMKTQLIQQERSIQKRASLSEKKKYRQKKLKKKKKMKEKKKID